MIEQDPVQQIAIIPRPENIGPCAPISTLSNASHTETLKQITLSPTAGLLSAHRDVLSPRSTTVAT